MLRKSKMHGIVIFFTVSYLVILSMLNVIGTKTIDDSPLISEYGDSTDWMNPDWQYRIDLTINHDFIDEDLVDFPVWVDITSDSLSDNAQSDGNDICFYGYGSYNEMELLYGASGKAPVNERGGHDISIKNSYAYVPCYWADVLDVFDISNPYHPVLVANLTNAEAMLSGVSLDGIHDIVIQEDYAYVTNCIDNSIAVIDISDPLNPRACGYYHNDTTLYSAHGLDVYGNYLYSGTCYDSKISIIDISDPTTPTQVAYIDDSPLLDCVRGFTYNDGYLYVTAATTGRLTCINVLDPSNPFIEDSLELYCPSLQFNNVVYNKINGDFCYVTSMKNAALYVVDISQPDELSLYSKIKSTQYLYQSYYLTLDGNYAYVSSNRMNSLAKVDISDPSNPTIVDFVQHNNLLNFPSGMFAYKGYLYVSTRDEYGQPYSLIRINKGYNLSHEIEFYDSETGHLCAWVKIPKISSSVDTIFALYYGNPQCGNQQLKENVWHSNYTMIQHFCETSGNFEDSTINNNDGIGMNGVIYDITGKNYNCVSFDGIDDYISCGNDDSLKTNVLCLEMWIKNNGIITDGDDVFGYVGDRAKLRLNEYGDYLYWAVKPSSNEYKMFIEEEDFFDDQEWHHLVLQKDKTHLYMYIDGSEVFNLTDERQICPGEIIYHSSPLKLGCHSNNVRNWPGLMDEFRVSSRNVNHSWVKASYSTTANNNFLSFTQNHDDIEYNDDEINEKLIDNDREDEREKETPGFEFLLFFSALLLILFWKRRRF